MSDERKAWKVVGASSDLKECPYCYHTALEGEEICGSCGCEPGDDVSWRVATSGVAAPESAEPCEHEYEFAGVAVNAEGTIGHCIKCGERYYSAPESAEPDEGNAHKALDAIGVPRAESEDPDGGSVDHVFTLAERISLFWPRGVGSPDSTGSHSDGLIPQPASDSPNDPPRDSTVLSTVVYTVAVASCGIGIGYALGRQPAPQPYDSVAMGIVLMSAGILMGVAMTLSTTNMLRALRQLREEAWSSAKVSQKPSTEESP